MVLLESIALISFSNIIKVIILDYQFDKIQNAVMYLRIRQVKLTIPDARHKFQPHPLVISNSCIYCRSKY